ncbi:GRA9 protein, putative [Eimeria brunetti]|uniref:GRA9 protein, putative n=1 Tax=Eimeria brunetti TaxID=51314 RepID=U6L9K2_9EIME|nr:GRA9 protein, putative [Eimeria brunetti]
MAPLRVQVAAFAAMVAVQLNISGSFAGNEAEKPSPQGNESAVGLQFPNFFGDGSLAELDKMLQHSFASLLGGFGSFEHMFRTESAPFSLILPDGDDPTCQIKIKGGSTGRLANGMKLGIDTSTRTLHASFHHEESQRNEDGEKKRSFLSQTVHLSSTLGLPERCLATPGVLMSGFGGMLMNSDGSEGLVVLPSTTLIEETMKEGALPEETLQALQNGDQHFLSELQETQQCLVAGFTAAQCAKLGGAKPTVAFVPPASGSQLPVPRFDVSLEALN